MSCHADIRTLGTQVINVCLNGTNRHRAREYPFDLLPFLGGGGVFTGPLLKLFFQDVQIIGNPLRLFSADVNSLQRTIS